MTISLDAANALESAIDGKIKKAATGRRRASGTVSRVDRDGTVYAVLESGIETVVEGLTASVNPGDTVSVTVEDGRAEVLGNYTDPSAGVQYVRAVEGIATEAGATAHAAVDIAAEARQVADEANKVAQATNQHFFADTNGAHITDVTQDEWNDAVADEFSDYDPTTKPYHNQLLNSLGILLRTALNNLVSITRSAIAFYDGTGNAASNIVARFGSAGAQIGQDGKSHLELDYHSMRLIDEASGTYLHVSDLRDSSGEVWYHKRWEMDGHTPYISVSPAATSSTYQVFVFDDNHNDVTANYTIQKGTSYIILNPLPAAGYVVWASYKSSSNSAKVFTFGSRNVTGGDAGGNSSSFGFYNVSQGECSFASGSMCISAGRASHAMGTDCKAMEDGSMAFGGHTKSSGVHAQAQNFYTIAGSPYQTAIGKYNEADYLGTYALIIGNGTADNARSNALAVKWTGDIECATDTSWITLNGAIKYRIHHGVCFVCGDSVNGGTSVGTGGTNVGTLPVGARPSVTVTGAASTKSNAANGQYSIDSSGVIKVWNLSTSSPYWCFMASYPVG